MDLRSYLQMFRRRWRLVLACFTLIIAAATLVTVRSTPQYASTAQLFISTPSSDVGGVDSYQGSLFSQQRVASYADLITGKALTQQVVDNLHLSEGAEALSRQVTSKVVPETVLLDVTVTDPSPGRAQRLAFEVARQFTSYVRALETPPGRQVSPIKATIVDTPSLPTTPVAPQPVRNIGLAAVLGLLLGLGLAVLRESLDTTIKTTRDVTLATRSSLLAHIPFDPHAARLPLITDLDPHAPRAESTRMLRTNLQFVDVDKSSKVFVVTSSVPEEGKTTTAINLAIASAKTGQSVLLLEGDLRRPKVGDYLHLESTVGLTTVLIGRVDIDDAIQSWGTDGLDVLTSGAKPPNPAELLQSVAMLTTLDKLRACYDLIIVDAPPLLPVTDGALLSAQADGAILVVRHGKTTKDQLSQASHHLAAVDARLLGTVLNMMRQRAGGGYGYGYAYGYGYGYAPDGPKRRRRPSLETSDSSPSD
ncbi:MAG: polysaccharide biosynthesis tyrosine autokinase [Actinomycetota bacterium]|nr:polysaccharide biosynthesis tyrosine autokinase [Actinomycetota bacterium]